MVASTVTKTRRRARRAQHAPLAGVQRYRFTPDQFEQLGRLGLFDHLRVELIGGEIIQMPPIGPEHGSTVDQTMQSLGRRLPAKPYYLRVQNPLRLGDSEPVPDVAIVPGKPSDYRTQHPTTALLVIEIADTSLEYDRTEKMSLYAAAGIPEYWIVNLVERCVEVYREPASPAAGTAFNARYRALRYYGLDETVSPLFEPTLEVPVRALLEGEE